VVAGAGGAPAEVVAPLGQSCLVPPEDAGAWADALVRVADDRFVDAKGRAGRRAYEAAFTREIGLAKLLDTYRQAMRG
jgi:glycosyltransferase involved in cell wall biosynthesis